MWGNFKNVKNKTNKETNLKLYKAMAVPNRDVEGERLEYNSSSRNEIPKNSQDVALGQIS
jgi:hypothetical protein